MKNYLLTVLENCSDEKFGQEAVEWAIVTGRVTLTYNLETDLKTIMGDCVMANTSDRPGETNYDRIGASAACRPANGISKTARMKVVTLFMFVFCGCGNEI